MSARLSIVAFVSAGVLWMGGCQPDVHIHIYNYETEGQDDDDEEPTAGSMGADGTAGDGTPNPMTSGTPPATSGTPMTGGDETPPMETEGGENFYPQPMGGVCPDGFTYSQIVAGFEFCAPPCESGMCPPPLEGGAPAQCAFNPDSSNEACTPEDGCMVAGETCNATMGCTLAPSHCALVCAGGQACPTGMSCSPIGACQFPA